MTSAVAFALLHASYLIPPQELLNKRRSGEINNKRVLSFATLHPGPIKGRGMEAANIAGLACVDLGGAAVTGKTSGASKAKLLGFKPLEARAWGCGKCVAGIGSDW